MFARNLDIIVRKRKYDGRIKSEWEGELFPSLGTGMVKDAAQEWLVVLHHPDYHLKFQKKWAKMQSPFFLQCFSRRDPLAILLEYGLDGQFRGAKCDAALPTKFEENVIDFCDLDLDLIVAEDFSSYVRDHHTFHRNRVKMSYPPVVVRMAHEGIELAQTLLEARQFPFDARHASLDPRLMGTPASAVLVSNP